MVSLKIVATICQLFEMGLLYQIGLSGGGEVEFWSRIIAFWIPNLLIAIAIWCH